MNDTEGQGFLKTLDPTDVQDAETFKEHSLTFAEQNLNDSCERKKRKKAKKAKKLKNLVAAWRDEKVTKLYKKLQIDFSR